MRTSDFDPVAIEVFHRQLKLVTLLVVVVFGVLVLRLGFLQIAGGMAYRAQSENNRIRLQDIPAVRGLIYDAHGDLLVSNRPAYDLYAIPEDMGDQRELLEGLERLIGLQPETVEERLKGSARRFPFRPVRLVKDMSREELAVIETHRFNLPGIMINVRPQRYYHFGPLGFHVLGYLGEISESQLQSGRHAASKSGDWIGQSGVERRWESALGGERGGEQLEMDAVGRRIRVMSRKAPVSGANVFLTLDRGLQALAEKALAGQRGNHRGRGPPRRSAAGVGQQPGPGSEHLCLGPGKGGLGEHSAFRGTPAAEPGQHRPISSGIHIQGGHGAGRAGRGGCGPGR